MDEPLKKRIFGLLQCGLTTVEGLKAKLPSLSTDEIRAVLDELEREEQVQRGEMFGRDAPVSLKEKDDDETQEINAVKF